MNALGLPTINNVKGFVEVPETMSWMRKLAGKTSWAQEGAFVATADQKLELNGELVEYVRTHGITWTPVPSGTRTNSPEFLASQSQSGLWQAWSETTQSGSRYTIFIDYRDHSATIESDEALKDKILDLYRKETARSLFSGQTPDIERILTSLTYKCGIPLKSMGFLLEHIKSITQLTPNVPPPQARNPWWKFWA